MESGWPQLSGKFMISWFRYMLSVFLLCGGQVAHAFPNRFDLDCKPLASAPPYSTVIRFRIDADAGIWCSDKCLLQSRIVKNDDTSLIIIDESKVADAIFTKTIIFDWATQILSNETELISGYKTTINYNCVVKEFTGFFPDKSQQPIITQPFPGPADYPPEAKRLNIGGKITVQLQIDATGKLISCDVNVSSGSLDLDRGTCQFLISRGRFLPARDVNGDPIAAGLSKVFNWQL